MLFIWAAAHWRTFFGFKDNWGQVKKLTPSTSQSQDKFGKAVAISDETAVIGAATGGAMFVFNRDAGGPDNWGQVKRLVGSIGGQSAGSVAIHGATAVMGSSKSVFRGAVYIFSRDKGGPNNWGEVNIITPDVSVPKDGFSYSVAIDGVDDRTRLDLDLIVGAPDNDKGPMPGSAYIFKFFSPDNEPPVAICKNITLSTESGFCISDASIDMVPVIITAESLDNCDPDPPCYITAVESNESINDSGDGNTSPDWVIMDDLTVKLRAERSGTGNGRIYTITVECTDEYGNSATDSAAVTVPHDKGKKKKKNKKKN